MPRKEIFRRREEAGRADLLGRPGSHRPNSQVAPPGAMGTAGSRGSVGGKLSSVENNRAQTWLPAGAQSLEALNVTADHFGPADVSYAVIVCTRAGGADRR